jgi:hypothetical protein
MPESENLIWLQAWYRKQCDGNWEHSYGIHNGTIDNPGWEVNIDLQNMQYTALARPDEEFELSDDDWMICRIRENKFEGFGDPSKLDAILGRFRKWINAE